MVLTEDQTEAFVRGVQTYREDPVAFVKDVIFAAPGRKDCVVEPEQEKVLKAIASENAVAVKAGHGIGKTAVEAWVILWFMACFEDARVPCTAPTAHQLEDVLWPEVAKWLAGTPLAEVMSWEKQRLSMKGHEDTWFAVPRSASKPENLQGFHGKHLLFDVDEASGVDQRIMEVIEGALTNEGAKLLMAGNPTQISGSFFNAFHRARSSFATFTFSALDSRLVDTAYSTRVAERYGEQSDVYRVRVLGEFPKGEPDTFIRLDAVEHAIARDPETQGPIKMAVDPARFGDDESVVGARIGSQVLPVQGYYELDGPQLGARVIRWVQEIRKAYEYTEPIEVRIDETGVGASCVDYLRRKAAEHRLLVIPINFGSAGNEDYHNLGSKIWGDLRDALDYIQLPDDGEATGQMVTRKYQINERTGKIELEKKEHMKRRLQQGGLNPSPDRADCFAMLMADLSDRPFSLDSIGVIDSDSEEAIGPLATDSEPWRV